MTTKLRQMTETERAFLAREIDLRSHISIRDTLGHIAGDAIYFTVILGGIALIFWEGFTWYKGLSSEVTNYAPVYWGLAVIWLTTAVCCVTKAMNSYAKFKTRHHALAADASVGIIEEQTVSITEVKSFRVFDHPERIYFLLFFDGRIRVKYDYANYTETCGKPKRRHFPIHRNLTMIRFPQSDLVKYDWSGPVIRKPQPLTLEIDPKLWPEDETYCTIPWDDLAAVLSPPA